MFVTWPLRKFRTAKERLFFIHENLAEKEGTLFPFGFSLIAKLGALLPSLFLRCFYNQLKCTIGATFLPGPDNVPPYLGCAVESSFFTLGCFAGKAGMKFTIAFLILSHCIFGIRDIKCPGIRL